MENKLMFKSPSQNYSTVNTSIDSDDVIITFEVSYNNTFCTVVKLLIDKYYNLFKSVSFIFQFK